MPRCPKIAITSGNMLRIILMTINNTRSESCKQTTVQKMKQNSPLQRSYDLLIAPMDDLPSTIMTGVTATMTVPKKMIKARTANIIRK
mmetsp:Transcript_26460/g.31216  ORF Transcript_26460/g.31216 Transcript_26460/m.31216 type:complete len:88 (-) Transcript_26460:862-1125(-)